MNEIFDVCKLPERMLSVRRMIALHQHPNIGDVVRIVKRDMAMQLATKILEGDKFFWERFDNVAQFSTLEYGADCIVMTAGEYAMLKRESFKEGVTHAQGFMGVANET